MQLLERVKNCNGCSACVVPCKLSCVKMHERTDEEAQALIDQYPEKQSKEGTKKVPVVNEGGCSKCNACVLFCPLYNPVELPVFEDWYEFTDDFDNRDMPKIYRETMRAARAGQHVEFVGTLCEIAALKSLNGDVIPRNLILKPLLCDQEKREKEPACQNCMFY